MVFSSERTAALYCPACERVQFHSFSIFELNKNEHPFQCECGFTQGQVERRGRRYEVRLLSPAGDRVRLLYGLNEMFGSSVINLLSLDGDEVLGFIGSLDDVERTVAAWDTENLDDEEFQVPDVMYQILASLQSLAGTQGIRCECANPSVGIDVYPDKVELVCSHCGSAVLMKATTASDLKVVQELSEIVMKASSYAFLDEF